MSTHTEDASQEPAGLSSIELVSYGILAGIYLLYSVAWLITVLRNPTHIADGLGDFMFVTGLWLAVFTPAAWFGAVLWLGRGKSTWLRLGFLVVGALLFIPWPYVTWAG